MVNVLLNKIKNRLVSQLDAEKRNVLTGLITVCMFLVVGRLVGALKEMAIASHFGVGAVVDAYSFLFNLVIFPVSIWFSLLSVILIPLLAKIEHQAPEHIIIFKSQVLGFTLLVAAALTPLFNLLCPLLIKSQWLGLSHETISLALSMLPNMSCYIFIGFIISLFSVFTMSYGKHANTLLESMPGLCTFLGILMFSGIFPLVWGLIIGALIQMVLLFIPLYRASYVGFPRFCFSSPWWTEFYRFFFIMIIGQILVSSNTIVDQFFSAKLGEGAISSLNYANKILALLLGISATAINRAILPVFSKSHFSGKNIDTLALSWTKYLFFGGVIFISLFYFLSEPAVKLLFERGAFTSQNTHEVSQLLQLSLLSLPFYICTILLLSYQASVGRQATLAKVGIMNFIIKVIFCFILVPTLKLYGVLLSSIICQIITFFYACHMSYKKRSIM